MGNSQAYGHQCPGNTTWVPTSPVPRGVFSRHGCRCPVRQAGRLHLSLGGQRTATRAGLLESQGRGAVRSRRVLGRLWRTRRSAGSDLGSAPAPAPAPPPGREQRAVRPSSVPPAFRTPPCRPRFLWVWDPVSCSLHVCCWVLPPSRPAAACPLCGNLPGVSGKGDKEGARGKGSVGGCAQPNWLGFFNLADCEVEPRGHPLRFGAL